MHTKQILYLGQQMLLACDGKCNKAWGITKRPKEQLGADVDDVAYLADGELGDAPAFPGTYEGGWTKPRDPGGMNKWCSRECERSAIANNAKALTLPDWSRRAVNQPWKHKAASSDATSRA